MMACTLKMLFLAAAATLFLSFTSLLVISGNASSTVGAAVGGSTPAREGAGTHQAAR